MIYCDENELKQIVHNNYIEKKEIIGIFEDYSVPHNEDTRRISRKNAWECLKEILRLVGYIDE